MMTIPRRFPRARGLAAAVAIVLAPGYGIALAQNFVPSALARQYFRVEWESARTKDGRSLVRGYVYNLSPYEVANVRLGVEALDTGGEPVGAMMTGWANGDISANGGRRYFEVRVALSAADYRITVQSYDIRSGDTENR